MKSKPCHSYCGYTSTNKKVPRPIYDIIDKTIECWKGDNKALGEQANTDKLRDKMDSSVDDNYLKQAIDFNFDGLYQCDFSSDKPSDYPELKSSTNFSNIYHHICKSCEREFFGYKRRCLCLDCEMVKAKVKFESERCKY